MLDRLLGIGPLGVCGPSLSKTRLGRTETDADLRKVDAELFRRTRSLALLIDEASLCNRLFAGDMGEPLADKSGTLEVVIDRLTAMSLRETPDAMSDSFGKGSNALAALSSGTLGSRCGVPTGVDGSDKNSSIDTSSGVGKTESGIAGADFGCSKDTFVDVEGLTDFRLSARRGVGLLLKLSVDILLNCPGLTSITFGMDTIFGLPTGLRVTA